jgi:hypothetical protein
MSQENVEAMRSVYVRFAYGDFRALANLSDDVEFVVSPEAPDAGTYRGEAARQWLRAWVESFEPLTIEATEFIDATTSWLGCASMGGCVVAPARSRAAGGSCTRCPEATSPAFKPFPTDCRPSKPQGCGSRRCRRRT